MKWLHAHVSSNGLRGRRTDENNDIRDVRARCITFIIDGYGRFIDEYTRKGPYDPNRWATGIFVNGIRFRRHRPDDRSNGSAARREREPYINRVVYIIRTYDTRY